MRKSCRRLGRKELGYRNSRHHNYIALANFLEDEPIAYWGDKYNESYPFTTITEYNEVCHYSWDDGPYLLPSKLIEYLSRNVVTLIHDWKSGHSIPVLPCYNEFMYFCACTFNIDNW